MPSAIEIRPITHGTQQYKQELELRQRIMRLPIGLDIYAEDLSREPSFHHFGAFCADELVGVIVLGPMEGTTAEVRGICVDTARQQDGIGRMLMDQAEHFLPTLGYDTLTLHARVYARGFYEKLGYSLTAPEEFIEVGIPHVAMAKKLV